MHRLQAERQARFMSEESTDQELLGLAAAGNQNAFAQLVQRHQSRVLNLAYGFSRDRQDSEELAQEIFFKVWRHARTFRGQSAFSTWLYRLAVNTCLNHRQGKKTRPDPLPLAGDFSSASAPAADELVAAEREIQLKNALAALPARQKMALLLASFEEKSYEEIAAVMEVSVPAVESLLFRARKNLAEILRPLKKKGDL
jgi:RNA polymerase sigma-70 factor (ECF subfamily)